MSCIVRLGMLPHLRFCFSLVVYFCLRAGLLHDVMPHWMLESKSQLWSKQKCS